MLSSLTLLKKSIVFKKNISPKMKDKFCSVCRNIPTFCERGGHMKTIVGLYQCIEQLVCRPHRRLTFCECRIQGSDPVKFIVMKDIFFMPLPVVTGCAKYEENIKTGSFK